MGVDPSHGLFDEGVEQILGHVDPLDPAAALARIEHRAVHQRIDRSIEVGVGADIAGILASEFGRNRNEGACRRALHGLTAADRAGEVDEIDCSFGNQGVRRVVVDDDVLKDLFRHSGRVERLGQTLADLQALAGMLEDHRIPGNERGGDGVDRGHVRIVPGRHDQDDAPGQALELAQEGVGVFNHGRCKTFGGDTGHIPHSLVEAAEFASVADRAAHLVSQFQRHAVGALADDLGGFQDKVDPLFQRAIAPTLLRATGFACGRKGGITGQGIARQVD